MTNEELLAKLTEAEWLICELEMHEGAEGWSEYLSKRLENYRFITTKSRVPSNELV